MWTCPNCGEQVEKNFLACWNCEAERPESIDLNEKWKIAPLACPRCGAESQHLGTKSFLEEKADFVALVGELLSHIHLSELFADRASLDVYVCPKCGLEFFIDNSVGSALRAP
jgi:ribosomal protein S27AE